MVLLSDGYIANGTEPGSCRTSRAARLTTFAAEPNHVGDDGEPVFWPYA